MVFEKHYKRDPLFQHLIYGLHNGNNFSQITCRNSVGLILKENSALTSDTEQNESMYPRFRIKSKLQKQNRRSRVRWGKIKEAIKKAHKKREFYICKVLQHVHQISHQYIHQSSWLFKLVKIFFVYHIYI